MSSDVSCALTATVGDLLQDFSIEYRGFFVEDYRCTVERYESAGHEEMQFELKKHGLACDEGYVHVRLRGRVEEITPGHTYSLCGDQEIPNLRVTVDIGQGEANMTAYRNLECEVPGEFVLHDLGDATGEPYSFYLQGRLSELDSLGNPTGETVDIELDSDGLVEVDTPE